MAIVKLNGESEPVVSRSAQKPWRSDSLIVVSSYECLSDSVDVDEGVTCLVSGGVTLKACPELCLLGRCRDGSAAFRLVSGES